MTTPEKSVPFEVGAPLPDGKVEPQLVAAYDKGILLAPDGSLWGCGDNRHHSLGLFPDDKHPVDAELPKPLPMEFEAWALSTSRQTTLLLTRDGALWSWGRRLGTEGANRPPWIVRLFRTVTSRQPGPGQTDSLVDARPYKIWQLPESD